MNTSGKFRSYALVSLHSKWRIPFRGIVSLLIVGLVFLSDGRTFCQMPLDSLYIRYTLVKEEDNTIQNAFYLEGFFEKLFQQQMLNDRKINILHIGDSHIQADYLTAPVRRRFQQQFGNAGRGFIVPYAVAGTNGPFGIVSRSKVKWNVKRCVSPDNPLPIGVGGITIQSNDPQADLEIYMNDLWMDYSFRDLTVFFQKDSKSFSLSVTDTAGVEIGTVNSFPAGPFDGWSRVELSQRVSAVHLHAKQTAETQDHITIFGLCADNGRSGILYHNIGVNGAKYEHYNAASLFASQTAGLNPDLIIISLGTNEAISFPYLDKNFPLQIERLVNALRANNPDALFVLVTPSDAFRKKTKHNPGIAAIRQQIVNYAVENGLAFYDLYKAGGGDMSASAWKERGLLRSDGIHFTKEGYEYQGNLLYHALMSAYNNYVLLRHP